MIQKSFVICLCMFLYFLSAQIVAASFMYMSPSGGDMKENVVFPVQVRLSTQPNEAITSTSVYLAYPEDKLDIAYIKSSDSFPVELGHNYASGTIAITRQNVNGVSGDFSVVTIGFKPKISNDSVNLMFIDGTRASLADGKDTLDLDLTKSRASMFNIVQGTGSSRQSYAVSGQQLLPEAGSLDGTYWLFLIGGGLIFIGTLGILRHKFNRFLTK